MMAKVIRGLRRVLAVPFFSLGLGLGLWAAVFAGIAGTLFWLGRRIAGRTPDVWFSLRLILPAEDSQKSGKGAGEDA